MTLEERKERLLRYGEPLRHVRERIEYELAVIVKTG